MNYVQRLEQWGASHHPKYIDILRIAFGIFLCFKGIEFGNDKALWEQAMQEATPFNAFLIVILVHYIIFAHAVGGFMIAAGLLTRVACIAQIPILLGALIFIHSNVVQHFSEFFLSLLTLLMLIYFLIVGSGPWSLDRLITENDERNERRRRSRLG